MASRQRETQADNQRRAPQTGRQPKTEGDRHDGFWERAAKLRDQMQGRHFTPSEELIRLDRYDR